MTRTVFTLITKTNSLHGVLKQKETPFVNIAVSMGSNLVNKRESLDSTDELYYRESIKLKYLWALKGEPIFNSKHFGLTVENGITKLIMVYHFENEHQFLV